VKLKTLKSINTNYHILPSRFNNLPYFFYLPSADNERDVYNEKPTKEEIVAATEVNIFNCLVQLSQFFCFIIRKVQ
jgi:hypothetical protein